MNSFNTFHNNINRNNNISYKPGLYFNIYQGYHDEDVNYDSIAPQKVGYTSGYTSDISDNRIGTNNQLLLEDTDPVSSLYTVVWNGLFRSNYTGTYTFKLISGDGSYLWIGDNAKSGYTLDNALIKNGGIHGDIAVTATYSMVAGAYYPIRILFGENYGGDSCSFYWSTNGGTTYKSNGTGFFFNNYVPITPNTDKLVLWYTFLSDGGSNVYDNMGNYNGTLQGATFETINKKVGTSSAKFIATTSTTNIRHIDVADLPASLCDANVLSFSFWFRSNGTADGGRIFDFGNGDASYNIISYIHSGSLGFSVCNSYVDNIFLIIVNNVNDNVWRHCVWVLDGTTWRIYINGTLYSTRTSVKYPPNINRTNNYIGKSNWADLGYNGNIDDFRIYKEALTYEKVTMLFSYNRKNYTNNLLLWYTFDSNTISGTTVIDNMGNYNGTLTNGATTSTTTVIKGTASLYLQNTNTQHVSIPTFTVSSSLSFSFWINPANAYNNICIFDSANAIAPNANNIVIYLYLNKLGFSYNVNNNERNDWYTLNNITDIITTNTWTHVVIASYPTASNTNTIKIYINNVLITTNVITPFNANYSAAILPWARESNFIGRTNTSGYNTYTGYIDDFRIYNEVLTEDKIDILYNNYW